MSELKKNSKQGDLPSRCSSPDLVISYWSSYGEMKLSINGVWYLYTRLDVAVIKHFLYYIRTRQQPGQALQYLNAHATGSRIDVFA